MLITFCGVRGSTPAPGADYVRYGGNTSCVAVAHARGAAPVLALDAGTGLANLTGLLGGAAFAGTILLSHLHWDHSLGLPFFRAGDRDDARVTLLLPEQAAGQGGTERSGAGGASAERLLGQVMSPPFFPIRPGELRGSWEFGAISPGPAQGRRVHRRGQGDPAQGRPDARLPGQRRPGGPRLRHRPLPHQPRARARTGSAPTTRPRSSSPATRTCSFTTPS